MRLILRCEIIKYKVLKNLSLITKQKLKTKLKLWPRILKHKFMTTQILGSTLLRPPINKLNFSTSHSLQVLNSSNSISIENNSLGFNSFVSFISQQSTTTRAQSELNKCLLTFYSNLSHTQLNCMCQEISNIDNTDNNAVSSIHRNRTIFNN